MKINKKKVLTLFALTLLIITLMLVNMNGPTSAAVTPEEGLIYLHGPPLTPVHMNSNKTLTPVHVHYREGIFPPYEEPVCTWWHALYPEEDYCKWYHIIDWEDTNGDLNLNPNDQIEMMEEESGNITWYHVDRITYTLNLSWPWPGEPTERKIVELKKPPEWEPEPFVTPVCTYWHEIRPSYSNVYHIIPPWGDNGDNQFGVCDTIWLNDTKTGAQSQWHVDDLATDLILREKIMDPKCTWWHAIHPEEECFVGKWYHLTSWEDKGEPYEQLSPCDQIDMIEEESGNITWYHVDRVTVTLNVTLEENATKWMKIELKADFEYIYEVFKFPWYSLWHEVCPRYSNVYNLTKWDLDLDDNCNGVLDPCDWIWLLNITVEDPTAEPERWHIEDMTYDLILNEKITDPVCTDWHALYPEEEYCKWYHVSDWGDNLDGLLSPSDYVQLNDTDWYHVENVTLTLNLTEKATEPRTLIIEFTGGFEEMYWAKIEPNCTWWHVVYPPENFSTYYHLIEWEDDCNGVLSYCDQIQLQDEGGLDTAWWHVEEVAMDMVVKKIVPPPPMYWKESYPDYAPSGMPDFDERQANWNATGSWTWCTPTAVANSLWWMDSRFEISTTPPPTINSTFGLVPTYWTLDPWGTPIEYDDHDPIRVQPFIEHLAYLMDTDGNRTGAGLGTTIDDMQAGIAQYLSWTGVNPEGDANGDGVVNMTDYNIVLAANGTAPGHVNFTIAADIYPSSHRPQLIPVGWWPKADNVVNQSDLDLVTNNTGKTGFFYERTIYIPDFYEVEAEVERCEDVVLCLRYYSNLTGDWLPISDPPWDLGHCVTVAGINSTSLKIAISDPANDAFEAGLTPGRSPVSHTHTTPEPPYTTHNNASLVSHDIYNVTLLPITAPGRWALQGYVGAPPGPPGTVWAVVEAVVITSPLPPPPPPPAVGGVWVLVDKLALLAPYIAFASTIIAAVAVTAVLFKRKKKR